MPPPKRLFFLSGTIFVFFNSPDSAGPVKEVGRLSHHAILPMTGGGSCRNGRRDEEAGAAGGRFFDDDDTSTACGCRESSASTCTDLSQGKKRETKQKHCT